MYLQNNFLLDLGFHRIRDKNSNQYPKFIESIKDEINRNDIISGCFEYQHNHKFILVVLQQGNVILLQAERRGKHHTIRIEANEFLNDTFVNKTIKNYVDEYGIYK